ncbi:MAG: HU family DNA-binding protein [Muribaculaceae bacterium]|nr:HU family DNA-binding protein [Muribaculaceae bacterium]
MDNMTFIKQLGERINYDEGETSRLIELMASTFASIASEVNSIAIPGFGTFQPVKENEKIDVLPTGKRMLVPPHISLTFKESVVLRKKLKNQ